MWRLVLNGVEYSFALQAGTSNSLNDVANGLADAINAAGVFEASYIAADLTFGGTTAKGDVWSLVLNGAVVGNYTVASGEGLADVAAGLSAIAAGVSGFTSSTPGDTNVVHIENGAGFTVGVRVSGANVQGGVQIHGDTGDSGLLVSAVGDDLPFTVEVQRLESASDTNPPASGGSLRRWASTPRLKASTRPIVSVETSGATCSIWKP